MFDSFDHQCMSRALQLAELGLNSTDPNPRVGCVLARNGEIVATGWHRRRGEAHAEAKALESAGAAARGSTVYVTLEPCSHRGRTAACAPALIKAGVVRVVSAIGDDNPKVNGSGFSQLEAAGIRVETGLQRDRAQSLNAGFFMRMRHNRPWVRIKLAQSLDGGTALADGNSQWISSDASRADVQKWRARSSAVLTGIGTLLSDDPSLNVRIGESPRQPLRVIVDSHWRTPADALTLGLPGKVLIAGREDVEIPLPLKNSKAGLLALPTASGRVDLQALMRALSERAVNELQVEAGATLAGALLENRLVDEVLIYQAPILLGNATRNSFSIGPFESMAQRVSMQWIETAHTGPDLRLRLKPCYGKG